MFISTFAIIPEPPRASGASYLKKIVNLWIRENLVMTSGYERMPTGLTDSEGREKTQYSREGNPRRVPSVSI